MNTGVFSETVKSCLKSWCPWWKWYHLGCVHIIRVKWLDSGILWNFLRTQKTVLYLILNVELDRTSCYFLPIPMCWAASFCTHIPLGRAAPAITLKTAKAVYLAFSLSVDQLFAVLQSKCHFFAILSSHLTSRAFFIGGNDSSKNTYHMYCMCDVLHSRCFHISFIQFTCN